MIVLIENRQSVAAAFSSGFERAGVPCAAIEGATAAEWLACLSETDRTALDGIVVAADALSAEQVRALRALCDVSMIALADRRSLEDTLRLFLLGFDDVVSKPAHPLELITRLKVARRRTRNRIQAIATPDVVVFVDGRDPQIGGASLMLPRRERRILICLAEARGGWVTKAMLFNHVYGLFNDGINEAVVESHVSRLRKRLRERLGRDPVEAQRFLGYRLAQGDTRATPAADHVSHEQVDILKHGSVEHVSGEIGDECLGNHGHKRVGYGRSI